MVWISVDDKDGDFSLQGRCVPPWQLDAIQQPTLLDHLCALNVGSRGPIFRLSGIVCKIGKSSRDVETIEKLIENGMNIAYLPSKHGTYDYFAEIIHNVRTASNNYNERMGWTCPVALGFSTRGPTIRTASPILSCPLDLHLSPGDEVRLTGDREFACNSNDPYVICVDYKEVHNVAKVGREIHIRRRHISLICTKIEGTVVTCEVIKGGEVRSGQRVHFPGLAIDFPNLSPRDKSDIFFAVEQQLDIIFLTYVRNAATVVEARDLLGLEGSHMKIISQIEDQEGVKNIDEIIKVSDGILICRGDLSNETDESKVFLVQKSIIHKCNANGKPVTCATDFLRSLVTSPVGPTRAERCDVANAILDGADCIMLGDETAYGDHPIVALQHAAGICKEAEAAVWQKRLVLDLADKVTPPTIVVHAMATSAVLISLQLLASAIVVISTSMKSAQLLIQYRPKCPVIAVTRSLTMARQAHLYRGILPLFYKGERNSDWVKDVNLRTYFGINFGRKQGFIRPGDPVVIMTCSKQGCGYTDKMRILYIKKSFSHGTPCTC